MKVAAEIFDAGRRVGIAVQSKSGHYATVSFHASELETLIAELERVRALVDLTPCPHEERFREKNRTGYVCARCNAMVMEA